MKELSHCKIPKIFLCLILSFCLIGANVTIAPMPAQAEDAVGYLDKANDAIKKTNDIIKTADKVLEKIGLDSWSDVGAGLVSFGAQLSTGIGYTNMILKFLGFGGSSSTEISLEQKMFEEIQDMHNEVTQISAKVDQLINELSEFKSQTEFNERIKEARNRDDKWKQFQDEYITNGMESLIGDYDYKIRSGIKEWCKNDSDKARKGDLDNTSVVVGYEIIGDEEDATQQLVLTRDNGISERFKDLPCVEIKADALPQEMKNFSADTYIDTIKTYTSEKITSALDNGKDIDKYITVQNYPIFTSEGWKAASQEEKDNALNSLTSDLINVLQYRISVIQVNSDDNFTKRVIETFSNYCSYLTDKDKLNALDSLLNSIIMSNTFEGEARDTIQLYCASMSLKTSQYATFALDVLGKSDVTTKDESKDTSDLNKTVNKWQKTVDIINSALNNGIKGYDDFCYITQSRVSYATVQSHIKLSWKTDSSGNKDNGDYKIEKDRVYYTGSESSVYASYLKNFMIGESASAMLSYYYNSKYPDHTISFGEYLCQFIFNADGKKAENKFSSVLTNYTDGLQELTDADNSIAMHESWVYHDSRGLRHYPKEDKTYGELKKSNFNWKKKLTGDVLDATSTKINKNTTLCALVHSNANGNDRFLDYAYTIGDKLDGGGQLNNPRGRDNQYCYHDFVTLVNAQNPVMLSAAPQSTVEALGGTESQYSPFDSYNEWLDNKANKSGTALGSGNALTAGIIAGLGGLAIGILATYLVMRRRKKVATINAGDAETTTDTSSDKN
ncbi:MAG: hypothetical protein MJ189_02940 [Coriobacteriales bacterium]|nr:hypothetical protein [Coriobacteriales bacterium]